MAELQHHDIQGLVASGYAHMHRAGYLLLRVGEPDRARDWLGGLAPRLTTSEGRQTERCLHVAFTSAGLRALGVDDGDLKTFPAAFGEGMAVEHRTRILGDTEANAPANWAWGGPGNDAVHVLLLLFAKDESTFTTMESEERARLADGGLEVVHRMIPEPLPGRQSVGKFGVEHFGFADGMSQPVMAGSGREHGLDPADVRRHVIAAGEFVLGYDNGYDLKTPWPRLTAVEGGAGFGRNGTYLVFRQLAQDVAGFWQYLRAQARSPDPQAAAAEMVGLGAKLVGRWPDGAPLVKSDRNDPDLSTDNSFGYAAADPHGLRCPIAAHIRRTNPRDSLRADGDKALKLANLHRVLRRGRVYGPGLENPLDGDDGRERGLFFMCLNANLERQFEFIQQTWCNNPKFGGLYDEPDPLIANQPAEGGRFTIPRTPVRRRLVGIPRFVTTRGGAYFFLPGIRAVHQLAGLGG